MKDIAVIICNYNGKQDTINCVQSVLNQTFSDVDIFVVDNASSDGSSQVLKEIFGETLTLLQNEENMGGSGGFGRGLRFCMEKDYKYLMLLDNDAVVETQAIEKMYDYMEKNKKTGAVGAKIMMLENPERIWDYAKEIDFEQFRIKQSWMNQMDTEETMLERECDFVAATACMYRKEALKQAGGMDEEHFIYFDDIDLSWRIKLSGYSIISLGTVKAWHRSGMAHRRENTFTRYYMQRNQYRFFAKYIPETAIEPFAEKMLEDVFSILYGSHNRGKEDVFETVKYIFGDFLHDIRGKAGKHRIQQVMQAKKRVEHLLTGRNRIVIYADATVSLKWMGQFVKKVFEAAEMSDVQIIVEQSGYGKEECRLALERECAVQLENGKLQICEQEDRGDADLAIRLCNHVKHMKENVLPDIYIDTHYNEILTEEDYIYFRNYENSLSFFTHMYKEPLLERISEIRKENRWIGLEM